MIDLKQETKINEENEDSSLSFGAVVSRDRMDAAPASPEYFKMLS